MNRRNFLKMALVLPVLSCQLTQSAHASTKELASNKSLLDAWYSFCHENPSDYYSRLNLDDHDQRRTLQRAQFSSGQCVDVDGMELCFSDIAVLLTEK